jgi:hypothetical protein
MLATRRASLDRTAEGGSPHIVMAGRTSVAAEIEDGIADDLAGPMESHVAATVAFKEFNGPLGKSLRRGDYICGFGISAQRDDGRVFEQE